LNNGVSIVASSKNEISGNLIGTDKLGEDPIGNGGAGVLVTYKTRDGKTWGPSNGNQIFANVISASCINPLIVSAGVWIEGELTSRDNKSDYGTSGNILFKNIIGMDKDLTKPLGNKGDGVRIIDSSKNHIIGPDRSIIAGNSGWGIRIEKGLENEVKNTVIGGVDENTPVPNELGGIFLDKASGTTIGGRTPLIGQAPGNTILYKKGTEGIKRNQDRKTDVTGNRIVEAKAQPGPSPGPGGDGPSILLMDSSNGVIGGLTQEESNVISNGIEVDGSGSTGNSILGNYIGIDVDGTSSDNPGDGVLINSGNNNVIQRNTIWDCQGSGVAVIAAKGNLISQNSIYANSGLGIELGSGGNDNQEAPVLTSTVGSATATVVRGSLDSAPNTTFTLEFFASAVGDPSGYGQGQTYLGSQTATTDANGHVCFVFSGPGNFLGMAIAATATDPTNNTSEFSGFRVADSGFSMEDGGSAAIVTEETGYGGTDIKPTDGCCMLGQSSAATTSTSEFQDSAGHPGTAGTVLDGGSLNLTAGTTLCFDWFFTSLLQDTPDASEFALGFLNGQQIFGITEFNGSRTYDSGWMHYSTVIPADGIYQLVFVDSNWLSQLDRGISDESELYLSSGCGVSLDFNPGGPGPSGGPTGGSLAAHVAGSSSVSAAIGPFALGQPGGWVMTAPQAPTVVRGAPLALAVMSADQSTAPAKANALEVPAMVTTQPFTRDAIFADLALVAPETSGWSVGSTDLEAGLGRWFILPTSWA
jgi:hypothetical protein